MYSINAIKNIKKIDCKFCFASKIGLVWSYLSQNMGLFQPRKVQIRTKKEKKFSRSQLYYKTFKNY
jgi:hypothetical protein